MYISNLAKMIPCFTKFIYGTRHYYNQNGILIISLNIDLKSDD